jgi:mersacidin/lichenicidin family type 2 lantibiotic
MTIEDIIRAWKADENDQNTPSVANPIGEELTDQELQEATGGSCTIPFLTCNNVITCTHGITFCLQAPTA